MGQPDRPTLTAGASSQWAGAGHPFFARMYARMSPAWERRGYAVRRQELLAGLAGRVVEVGAGNGLNFRHYPPEVTAVLAVEPEPYLRARAEVNARRAPIPVEVVTGTAEHIAAESAAFDAGVVSLVLCSVSDTSAALAELHRVIRPGGELRFLEHVRADSPSLRRIQRLMASPSSDCTGSGFPRRASPYRPPRTSWESLAGPEGAASTPRICGARADHPR